MAKAAGMEVSVPEAPESREEQYLAAIAEGGGGGTAYTAGEGITIADDTISVDTTTIQPKLTAGTNVTITDNTISAADTTYNAFTGTDGTSAGTSGLVPAPATTDEDKFLKADGTWATVGGGGGEDSVNSLFLNKGSGSYQYLIPADSNEEKQLCKIINDYISGANKNFLISFAKDSSEVTHTSVSIQNVVVSSDNVGIIFIVTSNNLSGSGNRQYGITYKNLNYYSLTVYVSREEYDANNIQHVFSNSGLTGRTFILTSVSGANAWAIDENSLSIGPLGTTNTSSYTPTQDYHPATKKYVDTQLNTRLDGLTLLKISQTDYDNLQTKDANTLYVITGA